MTGPSVVGQLAWFFILTLIYTYLEYGAQSDADSSASTKSYAYKSIYVLLCVVGQYFITVSVTSALCGSPQYYTALLATVFPWIFIFGTLLALLSLFPGWILPFSNTFGYMIASAMGFGKLANKVFTKPQREGMSADLVKALSLIYTDKASLLSNITPSNFEEFWTNSGGQNGIRDTGLENEQLLKKKFRNFVILKHTVGTAVWYLLTGMLVISVSYNYIVNSECAVTVQQIAQNAEEAAADSADRAPALPEYTVSV